MPRSAILLAWFACGCGLDTFGDEDDETSGTEVTGVTTDATGVTTGDDGVDAIPISFDRGVDVLVVMDNTGSMAKAQGRLVDGFSVFIDSLEAVDANYRIGVTTTDAGNPRCPSTTPENGNFVLSSCLNRIDNGEFMWLDVDHSVACTANCVLRDEDVEVVPTATELDPNEAPRKWIEKIDGVANVQGVDSMVEAFRCYAPQGVAGCGFESHLESMYKALANAQSVQNKNNYGFLRASAILSIVIVSDETDCSYNPMWDDIFTTNKVFWYDPELDVAPSSATCWRAGVLCEGTAPTFDGCRAADWDDEYVETAKPETEAVLFPVAKYVEYVTKIEEDKQALDPNRQVLVSLISGVPIGYENFAAEIPYVDSPDLGSGGYQSLYGIGPGCFVGPANAPTEAAVPPVREREFAEAFNVDEGVSRNLYSVCDDDYSGALADIAGEIKDQIRPPCMPKCVRDTMPETSVLDDSCVLYEEDVESGTRTPIDRCIAGNAMGKPAWLMPEGASVCFGSLVDRDGEATPSPLDDMSSECVVEGFNLEFILVGGVADGARFSADCELSEAPAEDCPAL